MGGGEHSQAHILERHKSTFLPGKVSLTYPIPNTPDGNSPLTLSSLISPTRIYLKNIQPKEKFVRTDLAAVGTARHTLHIYSVASIFLGARSLRLVPIGVALLFPSLLDSYL